VVGVGGYLRYPFCISIKIFFSISFLFSYGKLACTPLLGILFSNVSNKPKKRPSITKPKFINSSLPIINRTRMTEAIKSIEQLLSKYNLQPHDLEYILSFMQREKITPQLAMRRIKLFEKLQEKMSKTQEDEKVKELTNELDHLSKIVEELQAERESLIKEKEKLQKEIEESRLQQDLFQAEREELKMQMKALMESISTIESESETEDTLKQEIQELKKNLNVVTAGIQTLKDELKQLSVQKPEVKNFVFELEGLLERIVRHSPLPSGIAEQLSTVIGTISTQVAEATLEVPVEIGTKQEEEETISPDQIKFIQKTPSKSTEPTTTLVKTKVSKSVASAPSTVPSSPPRKSVEVTEQKRETHKMPSRPVIKEKLFVEPEKLEKIEKEPLKKTEQPPKKESIEKKEVVKEVVKKEPTPAKPKKVDVSAKPITDEKPISAKTEKILKLFISYVNQADSDENFKARISAICDMDEAYVELGGLAMAQIYSYQTQGLKKKKEFERLLQSWIENGLPR